MKGPTMRTILMQQRQAVEEAGIRAEAELAELRAQRQRLSLDALSGKSGAVGASKALADLDAKIAEVVRTQDLARLASVEADRREQEAAERRAATQRAADAAELVNLTRQRDERYRRVQDLVAQLAPEVSEAIRLGGEIVNVGNWLGMTTPDRTRGQLYDFMATKLGRLGADVWAFDTPHPGARGDLVPEPDRA